MARRKWLKGYVVLLCLIVARHVRGDDWGSPETVHAKSPSGKWEATVTPGFSLAGNYYELFRLRDLGTSDLSAGDIESQVRVTIGPKKGRPHTYTLRSLPMPVDIALLDDGTLVTFDHWRAVGVGEVCIAYNPAGKVLWSRTLDDIFGKERTKWIARASICWRSLPLDWAMEPEGKAMRIRLGDENELRIRLADGKTDIIEITDLPDDPKRLLNRANALVSWTPFDTPESILFEKKQEAVALLERARRLEPADPAVDLSIHGTLMDIFCRQKKHDKVIETGKSALERLSGRIEGRFLSNIYCVMACSQKELELMKEAESSLRSAISAQPDYERPCTQLAELLYEIGREDDVKAVFQEFLLQSQVKSGLSGYDVLSVGDFYRRKNKPSLALEYYLKAYRSDRVTNQFLYEAIAQTYETLGNPREALTIYQQLIDYFESSEAYKKGPDIERTKEIATRLRKELD